MDLRAYYQQMREIEAAIPEDEVVVVSLPTPDGGREGVSREVARETAARLIVERRARLATAEEAEAHRERALEAFLLAEQKAQLTRAQLTLVSETDMKALRSMLTGSKA